MRLTEEREPVQRLYDRLAAALLSSRSEPFDTPVTVAEIYQELVPYRTVRGELGFSMNADYEHALLRLLSGEDELVRLEPASARDVIRRELGSPNPNVSIYREYAGCDAWVRPAAPGGLNPSGNGAHDDVAMSWIDDVAADDDTDAGADVDAAAASGARSARSPASSVFALAEPEVAEADAQEPVPARQGGPATPQPAGETAQRMAASPAPVSVPVGARCVFCDSGLPQKRPVRFCPYCGGDQHMRPCSACGEPLEAGWSFCVACGAEAHGG
jgi:hypothetical protein